MNRHYIIVSILIGVVCTGVGVIIGISLQPDSNSEEPTIENEFPVEEYIKNRKKELENEDTTFQYSSDDEDEPIVQGGRWRQEPIEAPAMETR